MNARREWLLSALNKAWVHGYGYAKGLPGTRRGDMLAILAEIENEFGPMPLGEPDTVRTPFRRGELVEVLRTPPDDWFPGVVYADEGSEGAEPGEVLVELRNTGFAAWRIEIGKVRRREPGPKHDWPEPFGTPTPNHGEVAICIRCDWMRQYDRDIEDWTYAKRRNLASGLTPGTQDFARIKEPACEGTGGPIARAGTKTP